MQLELFELYKPHFKIDKPIRLIELFGGIGSQAMALRNIKAPYETWKLVEYNKYPVMSYNVIHGANFEPMDITKVHAEDLEIVDTDKYTYIMTYSFPCQDLSIAGLRAGMSKDDKTRSGLLWEVERILRECKELPQVLLMENVTMVHSEDNRADFESWTEFLNTLGYSSYYQDLNSKDYGIAQSRDRCFMVSILGDYYYKFPKTINLRPRVKDYLKETEEKYYLKSQKAKDLIDELVAEDRLFYRANTKRLKLLGCMDCSDGTLEKDNRVYDMSGIAATITCGSSSVQGKYLEIKPTSDGEYEIDGQKYQIRIRKLNPIECWRIMGFTEEDYYKAEKVNSLVQLQKQAGNSIVVSCLMAIFSQMNIKGVDKWNDMSEEEIYTMLTNTQ
ncbi:MAG: DNA (cytosine-5-)-methyltransferase [Paludibacteraceae bacterium]|nr:DNA (cytosine-5-)-methyltransferase [Paludibacteraceae bacterium]